MKTDDMCHALEGCEYAESRHDVNEDGVSYGLEGHYSSRFACHV